MPAVADGPAAEPPTRKGRDARRRLLDAGRRLFGEQSYGAVRISDITAAAGLSSGAFYRYFGDRRALLLALLDELVAEVFAVARHPFDATRPEESVRITTERYFAFYERNSALLGVIVELAQGDAEVREIWRASRTTFYARIADALTRGRDAGVVRADLDVTVAAELLGSMTEFYAFQRYALGGDALGGATAEQAAATLTRIWTDGIRSGDTPPADRSRRADGDRTR